MLPLQGRVALVTGAGRGIGRAIALSLARHGADIAVNYASNDKAAEEVRDEIRAMGRRAEIFKCNIADDTAVHAMGETIKKVFPAIDILVNNAGITRDKTFMKMTHVEWDEVVGVNLKGPVQMTHLYLPQMVERGWGRVINITSVIGQMGNFGQANYAAAKGGLDAFTKSVAREVARKGVTVNCVAPGFIRTDMTAGVPEKALEHIKTITPMGRMGEAEEIAEVVSFLASPSASFVTGQEIGVNGGLYM
ncbi:MAG: 3-oxoacyl-[acyl-carrier-protein] reductase [Phycisphaerae bacterium]|jgi:3-oxoacyl-[acyl-carrier protein] reductase|nr:3-oxoacyl-[acyl-carrier-protein] reductase [Phycisphaerae bacterium]